jgi:hypothetical protein
VHDGDPVGEVAHHADVVGDEEEGQAELVPQLGEQIEDLRADGDVERRDRLVGDDQLRTQRQGTGDPDALPLAAGELVRVAVAVGRFESDALEQLRGPAAQFRA